MNLFQHASKVRNEEKLYDTIFSIFIYVIYYVHLTIHAQQTQQNMLYKFQASSMQKTAYYINSIIQVVTNLCSFQNSTFMYTSCILYVYFIYIYRLCTLILCQYKADSFVPKTCRKNVMLVPDSGSEINKELFLLAS